MASLASLGRLSGRAGQVGGRRLAQSTVARRDFRTSTAALAAQNFTMPALSPTMTEGNIATWRVKEGDKFQAGDVLLEIETDKATMDVEAQEEGVVMKILQGDGAKAVKVGARIAVLAEEGDDISTLEIPAEDESGAKDDAKEDKPQGSSTYGGGSAPPPNDSVPAQPTQSAAKAAGDGKAPKQKYPLLPSVAHLIKEKGLDEAALAEMTPSGPNGRLLKGDVLAYLGTINQKTPSTISEMFERLSHLDLSNIKIVKPAPPPAKEETKAAAAETPAPRIEQVQVSLPVSLEAAFHAHRKVYKNLAVNLPLATFIERAADIANEGLPAPTRNPSADDLFNDLLGLPRAGHGATRGRYFPMISSPAAPVAQPAFSSSRQQADIIDILSGTATTARKPAVQPSAEFNVTDADVPLFSLNVPKTEEKRAKVFLERIKVVLENEPARLLL
ncbi:hypothetical protein PpBr36_00513 [Pyricularia pennisetigena]|uniref:hypothetical protein n=1 Tax=Pyricularia pennisetigena TaxID=1578925 RepID=UPI00114DFDBF|nr:hypothetical protein PpBr36_00513 [Pyricularia pennisetigena]TLS27905.1 hypothetical protein PpBr36_00513 [Pyricularia pennisetigena]